ncbi:MAG: hypothetical protein OIN88_02520 [Candidatus Methanoperedens sp.]|nr:hypothetical protein [Candidatus Methanoperedens sp.]MCZ7359339.1 hypothetical protein [Candidatus Methanoperedens sp.]HLB72130.1 VTT domain-containing protein [Candidatus Methanoperedens sp.]
MLFESLISYGKYELRKLIPFHDREKEKQMQMYFRRYGTFILFFSPWIPLFGDLVPVVAGIESYESKKFLIVISAAKVIKGIAVVYFSLAVINWWTIFIK